MDTPIREIWARIEDRHSGLATDSGFILVRNLIGLETKSPFELAPGCYLRHALPAEMSTLHEIFPHFETLHRGHGLLNPYEFEYQVVDPASDSQTISNLIADGWLDCWTSPVGKVCFCKRLPPDNWRYHVLAHDRSDAIEDALLAAQISHIPLTHIVGVVREKKSSELWYQLAIHAEKPDSMLDERLSSLFTLSLPELEMISAANRAIEKLRVFPAMKERMAKACNILGELNAVHPGTRLKFLGLFTIIESLISHKPKGTDPTESLGRQVRQKMQLVTHRVLRKPVPYDLFEVHDLNEKNIKKVWDALYTLRSMIAHGDEADFSRGEIKMLKSLANGCRFVEVTVRVLLGTCVDEPQLMLDLHSC